MGHTKLTAELLARLLHEELEADDCDIDSDLLRQYAEDEDEASEEALTLGEVLERVVDRIHDEEWER